MIKLKLLFYLKISNLKWEYRFKTDKIFLIIDHLANAICDDVMCDLGQLDGPSQVPFGFGDSSCSMFYGSKLGHLLIFIFPLHGVFFQLVGTIWLRVCGGVAAAVAVEVKAAVHWRWWLIGDGGNDIWW